MSRSPATILILLALLAWPAPSRAEDSPPDESGGEVAAPTTPPLDVTITPVAPDGQAPVPPDAQNVQPPAGQPQPDPAPPPNPSLFGKGEYWWANVFVAVVKPFNGPATAPFRLGQIGVTKSLTKGCSVTFRADPFPWLGGYFESQLELPNSPISQSVEAQMRNATALQIAQADAAYLNPKMKGAQTAAGVDREHYIDCEFVKRWELKVGKMDDPSTINEAQTRPFESREAIQLTYHLPQGMDVIAQTFTFRGGLLDPTGGPVFSYVENTINPPAVTRGANGYAVASPPPLPFMDWKLDSAGGALRVDGTKWAWLRRWHVLEILGYGGYARAEPYVGINVTQAFGQTLFKYQWSKQDFLPEPNGTPSAQTLNVVGERAFRQGKLLVAGSYAETWGNGIEGPGVPGHARSAGATAIEQVGKPVGPGHFYVMGTFAEDSSTTPAGRLSGPTTMGGFGFQFGQQPEPH